MCVPLFVGLRLSSLRSAQLDVMTPPIADYESSKLLLAASKVQTKRKTCAVSNSLIFSMLA